MVKITRSLLARLHDQPGELAKLLEKLRQKGINISTLRVVPQEGGMAIAFFSVDRAEEALMIPEIEVAEDLPLPFQPPPPKANPK
jgi:prephenate dehydratase